MADLGEEIRRRRLARGWDTEDLADRAGVDDEELAEIEANERVPGASLLRRLAESLGVDPTELLGTATAEPVGPPFEATAVVLLRDRDGYWLREASDGLAFPTYTVPARTSGSRLSDDVRSDTGLAASVSTMDVWFRGRSAGAPVRYFVGDVDPAHSKPTATMRHIARHDVADDLVECPVLDALSQALLLRDLSHITIPGGTARVTETLDLCDDVERWSGRFSCGLDHGIVRIDGPGDLALEEALTWARAQSSRVALSVGTSEYSAGADALPSLPRWPEGERVEPRVAWPVLD